MVVGEGQGLRVLSPDDVCGRQSRYRLAAYDAFALLLHINLRAEESTATHRGGDR
jgi:hypothetical protein